MFFKYSAECFLSVVCTTQLNIFLKYYLFWLLLFCRKSKNCKNTYNNLYTRYGNIKRRVIWQKNVFVFSSIKDIFNNFSHVKNLTAELQVYIYQYVYASLEGDDLLEIFKRCLNPSMFIKMFRKCFSKLYSSFSLFLSRVKK